MLINDQTKIAALLKFHPDALEAIVPLSSDFKKLRNPILRKLMAGRTSIAEASRIGKCTPADFFRVLKPLGFEIEEKTTILNSEQKEENIKSEVPKFLKEANPEKIIDFDVRAMLAEGNDPLKQIQQKVKTLKAGEILKIINTFEPVPLIKLLGNQGFDSYVNTINSDHIETFFYKRDSSHETKLEEALPNSEDWDQKYAQFEGKFIEVDVRHLEMPMPMMTILESLETLPPNHALYVHHKRIPVFLLTELRERNFDFRIKEIQEGEVYLLIFKNNV